MNNFLRAKLLVIIILVFQLNALLADDRRSQLFLFSEAHGTASSDPERRITVRTFIRNDSSREVRVATGVNSGDCQEKFGPSRPNVSGFSFHLNWTSDGTPLKLPEASYAPVSLKPGEVVELPRIIITTPENFLPNEWIVFYKVKEEFARKHDVEESDLLITVDLEGVIRRDP